MSDFNGSSDPVTTDNQAAPEVTEQQAGSLLTGQTPTNEAEPDADPSLTVKPTEKPAAPAWMAQLTKDLQADESLTRFKTIGELGKAYRELEGKLGSSVKIPAQDATAEEWTEFYQKVGRPDDPKGYDLARDPLPKGLNYDEALTEKFLESAHLAGLSTKQAREVYKGIIGFQAERYQAAIADRQRETESTMTELRRTFGGQTDTVLKDVQGFIKKAADTIDPKLMKDIERSGLGNSVAMIKLFHTFAKQTKEDSLIGEGIGNDSQDGFSYPGL